MTMTRALYALALVCVAVAITGGDPYLYAVAAVLIVAGVGIKQAG